MAKRKGPGAGAAVTRAVARLASSTDPSSPDVLLPEDRITLLVTDPSVRIVDENGVMITRHSPHIPVARQYVIDNRGQVLRSVRSTLDAGVHSDDVKTAVYAFDADGTTLQLASGKGLGAAVTPMAPGLDRLLRHVERAIAVLMDKRNTVDPWTLGSPGSPLARLTHYQGARVRTELMNRLGAYFGTARLHSGFDTLLRQGFKISVTIRNRRFWQSPRRFEILVKADLLDRLDGGVSATESGVAVDMQTQGDLQVGAAIEQENAFMGSGSAELAPDFGPVVRFNVTELYVEAEIGAVTTRELATTSSTFSRLSAPEGEASRPDYRVQYKIDIAEFNRRGKQVDRWRHAFYDEVAPVVPDAFLPGPAAGAWSVHQIVGPADVPERRG